MPSCPDGIRALLPSSFVRSALYDDPWLNQVFRSAGLAFHAIIAISLFATRWRYFRLSVSLIAFSSGRNRHRAVGLAPLQ